MSEKDNFGKESSDEGDLLWDVVTQDVVPLEKKISTHKKDGSKLSPEILIAQQKRKEENEVMAVQERSIQKTTDGENRQEFRLPDIDRRTDEKLRRGKMGIDATLDLHGLSRDNAYEALQTFIYDAFENGRRSLLIITGKGRAEGSTGVLKEKTPEWLMVPPLLDCVLQFHTAQPKDGGEGALYVLLRKKRK